MGPLAIALDIGNTRIKLALLQNYQVIDMVAFDKSDSEKYFIDFSIKYPNVEKMIISDVTHFNEQLPLLWASLPKVVLNEALNLGYQSQYQSMETLGVDRMALMAAAAYHYPGENSLVISCGTCITYNFIENGILFLGGAISPGLQMRYRSMHEFTSKLPLATQNSDIELVGNSTITSLQSGAFLGMCAEIDGFIDAYTSKYGKINAVLTGGDMPQVQTRIKSRIFANANFIYEGLYHILLLNT